MKKGLSGKQSFFEAFKDVVKSLGIVFGDIGTSPLYTLPFIFPVVTFALVPATFENVLGVLSLIIWTFIFLVTIQYVWLAMSLSQKGEGGTIVLRELLVPRLESRTMVRLVTILSFLGVSFLIGDGVITPAISILNAVEGLQKLPVFSTISQQAIMFIACVICIGLFLFQRKGTEKVSVAFGPIMLLWFIVLAVSGLQWVSLTPSIIGALNPWHVVTFFKTNGLAGFWILSQVILAATGCEALYADMGHLGRIPITRAWVGVFIILIISYLGQGAFLLHAGPQDKLLNEMIFRQVPHLYVFFLILSIFATIIASQAMISGLFSIIYQGITTNILPKLKIDYTSRVLRSQIFIPSVNWFLLVCVLLAIIEFREANKLASAYGLAVTCSMTITSFFIFSIFYLRKEFVKAALAGLNICFNLAFLVSSTSKIPHGGYFSLMIAMVPLSLILLYTAGKRNLAKRLQPTAINDFIDHYTEIFKKASPIQGTGLFLTRSTRKLPPFITHTMFSNNIIYEENIILSVITLDKPLGISIACKDKHAPGLRIIEVRMGYMEILDLEKVLTEAKITPTAIFYGMEEIETKNVLWRVFSLIKVLTPSFVQFYKLPAHKLHGVVMRVSM